MLYLRAMIAGIFLPSIILPIILMIADGSGRSDLLQFLFPHVIPLLWGLWNVLYFLSLRNWLPGNETIKLLLAGGILGFIIAAIGVFWFQIPSSYLGIQEERQYLPLVIGPVLYSVLWLFVVGPLNHIVGIEKETNLPS
jgi:hypothetical protein